MSSDGLSINEQLPLFEDKRMLLNRGILELIRLNLNEAFLSRFSVVKRGQAGRPQETKKVDQRVDNCCLRDDYGDAYDFRVCPQVSLPVPTRAELRSEGGITQDRQRFA